MLLPISRASHRHLLARCWNMREDLTVYAAAYIALAELLQVPLLTPAEMPEPGET